MQFPSYKAILIWEVMTHNEVTINYLIELLVKIFRSLWRKFNVHVLLGMYPCNVNRVVFCNIGYSGKSGSLIMSRPVEVRSKRIIGLFSFTGIGNLSHCGRHENVPARTFFLPTNKCQSKTQWQLRLNKVRYLQSLYMKGSVPRSIEQNSSRIMQMETSSFWTSVNLSDQFTQGLFCWMLLVPIQSQNHQCKWGVVYCGWAIPWGCPQPALILWF